MKTLKSILLITVILCWLGVKSQESNGFRIAYNLTEIQGDFGYGLQMETPSFLHHYLTLKLRANQLFLDYDLGGKNTWSPFWHFGLGVSSNPVSVSQAVSLYGEGGAMLSLPNSDFSSSSSELGGYGLFGFNFNFSPNFCYFMEAGAIGSGARAEKSDNQRMYSNGFLINVGFKMHFLPKKAEN